MSITWRIKTGIVLFCSLCFWGRLTACAQEPVLEKESRIDCTVTVTVQEGDILCKIAQRLLVDDLWNAAAWNDKNWQLNDWVIDDFDGNGQRDMLVMVGEGRVAVPGEIWLYWNHEPAYVLKDEDDYYEDGFVFGGHFAEAPIMEDFDGDGNQELILAVYNGGNGGPGGRDTCFFRHVGNVWKECPGELPCDYDEMELGLRIQVICQGQDQYEAYCPWLGEGIAFAGESSREISEEEIGKTGGGNIRGFYKLEAVDYQGRPALRCRECLYGEGGNAHIVGNAVFLFVWDKDGVCSVADWWVEEN